MVDMVMVMVMAMVMVILQASEIVNLNLIWAFLQKKLARDSFYVKF